MAERSRIPKPTAERLSLYLREIDDRLRHGQSHVSSRMLGDALGLADARVRKDLACFGALGQPGVGYPAATLRDRIRRIMGRDQAWNLGLVGIGNIGRALLAYRKFREDGFEFVAAFDRAPGPVGRVVAGFKVLPLDSLRTEVRARGIRIGVIATPSEAAQEVADRLVEAGVEGILNFAPRRLSAPEPVRVAAVDLTVALEQLAFGISLGGKRKEAS